jgi:3-oxoadipate enol-lactonase/4-carboxymuconolactone decarboxylase
VVRYDLPGHGDTPAAVLPSLRADATSDGRTATTVADLAALVLDLADRLGLDRFAYAGLSLGGAIGTHLAVHHPERITSLTLMCTSARFGDPQGWHDRAAQVRAHGVSGLLDASAARWFTPAFTASPVARALLKDLRFVDSDGYAACCDALAAFDLRPRLKEITAPTLVLAGREDPATPPADARELADGIPDSTLVELPRAAHLAPAEQPNRALAALTDHLRRATTTRATRTPETPALDTVYTRGMTTRREVLGDAHVDRAVAATTAFTAPFQELITRYAWGEIWTRPGLDRPTRSCITLTALVAGGHHDELTMHVRAARRNGLSADEIGEVLLQCAIYVGVPAANAAFAIANRVLREEPDPTTDREEARPAR